MSWWPMAVGGIPVARRDDPWDGVEAVIDKDYTAADLAHHVDADALALVTGVDSVMLELGTDSRRWLGRIDVAEAECPLNIGELPGPVPAAAT